MIVSKTPYRISFLGGGTDIPYFYRKHAGAVLSTTIDKYMYIAVNRNFNDFIRLSYSRTESVGSLDNLEHELVREAMRLTGVTSKVDITTIGDIPAGTGLGSSSVVTVGILNSLHVYNGEGVLSSQLAKEACKIEIDVLNMPTGKQDQYSTAVGGLNRIEFKQDEQVLVEPIECGKDVLGRLQDSLMLFYTGKTRRANKILENSSRRTPQSVERLRKMKELVPEGIAALNDGDLTKFGELIHKGWKLKKNLSHDISSPKIDEYYKLARKAGAVGGKILGAGGGGFLLLLCEKDQDKVREALSNLRYVPFGFESGGTHIVYHGRGKNG